MNFQLIWALGLASVLSVNNQGTESVSDEANPGKDARALLSDIGHQDMEKKKAAIEALEKLGPKAKEIVPDLIAILEKNDPNTNRESIYVLGTIGPEARAAVPALIKALSNDDLHVQYWACRSLGKLKGDAKPAVPALIRLMGNGAASPRRNAAMALGNIGPTIGDEGVQALIKTLDDLQHEVKVQAAEALGKLGGAAQPALPRLEELIANPRYTARLYAATSHWILAGASENVLAILLTELQGKDRPWDAAAAFERLGERARIAIPELAKLIDSPDEETKLYAVESLGHIGPPAKAIVPALEKFANDEQSPEDLKEASKLAIEKILRK